jgi:hypothetical protein
MSEIDPKAKNSSGRKVRPLKSECQLLTGAGQIADWLNWEPRQVYHAVKTKRLPIGRVGASLVAYKSQLDQAIKDEIQKSMGQP